LSILICDVDHFKKINDDYGHLAGDDVLKQAASCFTASVRAYDMVGRYGGEEFLFLLIGCDAATALRRAEAVRDAIASHQFVTAHITLSITVSVGSVTSSDWGDDFTASQLLHEADRALYRAKVQGRNCVASAHPSI
jgi:diguanylate cyclase (GGDEF)-like protein